MQPQTRNDGAIAQLVDQRTENPCVPGSIPGGTTEKKAVTIFRNCFFRLIMYGFAGFYRSCANRGANQKYYDNNNQRTML